jgi:hypothetical protein
VESRDEFADAGGEEGELVAERGSSPAAERQRRFGSVVGRGIVFSGGGGGGVMLEEGGADDDGVGR